MRKNKITAVLAVSIIMTACANAGEKAADSVTEITDITENSVSSVSSEEQTSITITETSAVTSSETTVQTTEQTSESEDNISETEISETENEETEEEKEKAVQPSYDVSENSYFQIPDQDFLHSLYNERKDDLYIRYTPESGYLTVTEEQLNEVNCWGLYLEAEMKYAEDEDRDKLTFEEYLEAYLPLGVKAEDVHKPERCAVIGIFPNNDIESDAAVFSYVNRFLCSDDEKAVEVSEKALESDITVISVSFWEEDDKLHIVAYADFYSKGNIENIKCYEEYDLPVTYVG